MLVFDTVLAREESISTISSESRRRERGSWFVYCIGQIELAKVTTDETNKEIARCHLSVVVREQFRAYLLPSETGLTHGVDHVFADWFLDSDECCEHVQCLE